jgi:hypothetical protein
MRGYHLGSCIAWEEFSSLYKAFKPFVYNIKAEQTDDWHEGA